jgi:hypothetical protein
MAISRDTLRRPQGPGFVLLVRYYFTAYKLINNYTFSSFYKEIILMQLVLEFCIGAPKGAKLLR